MASESATQVATARQLGPDGKETGTVEVPAEFVPADLPVGLLKRTIVDHQANLRRGTQSSRSRGEIRGGGRKPWRQKGTGRARVGEIRTPLWRAGGTVFGPQPRSYGYALPRKIRRGALRAALAQRVQDGSLIVVDQLSLPEAKTKAAAELMERFGDSPQTLVIDVQPDEAVTRAFRNLQGVRLLPSGRLTARDVADTHRVIATRAAVERLQEVLGA